MTKSEARQMIAQWDSMPEGPEKNIFWNKLVPYINAYKDLWLSGKRLPKEPVQENKEDRKKSSEKQNQTSKNGQCHKTETRS